MRQAGGQQEQAPSGHGGTLGLVVQWSECHVKVAGSGREAGPRRACCCGSGAQWLVHAGV
jgi:hypothetical protein